MKDLSTIHKNVKIQQVMQDLCVGVFKISWWNGLACGSYIYSCVSVKMSKVYIVHKNSRNQHG